MFVSKKLIGDFVFLVELMVMLDDNRDVVTWKGKVNLLLCLFLKCF